MSDDLARTVMLNGGAVGMVLFFFLQWTRWATLAAFVVAGAGAGAGDFGRMQGFVAGMQVTGAMALAFHDETERWRRARRP